MYFALLSFLFSFSRSQILRVGIVMCLSVVLLANNGLLSKNIARTFNHRIPNLFSGIYYRVMNPGHFLSEYDLTLERLRKKTPLPELSGKVDMFAFDFASIFASGNDWSPRPIFQSYSAYTPLLAKENHDFLTSPKGPDYIFLEIKTIDNRIPTLDDGMSLPVLMKDFEVKAKVGNLILFQRKKKELYGDNQILLTSFLGKTNSEIELPQIKEPLFLSIDLEPTFIGRIISLIYKPSLLEIEVALFNGMTKKFRTNSQMMIPGFIVSPLIINNQDFLETIKFENDSYVRSIKILTNGGWGKLSWEKNLKIKFYKIAI